MPQFLTFDVVIKIQLPLIDVKRLFNNDHETTAGISNRQDDIQF